ncbi:hypothetical protein EDD22DRAFT_1050951 [Suillus occidentalis]|nr:hypothetical protein EDD22DRAFT_1050951 [Suillus occidentalis]
MTQICASVIGAVVIRASSSSEENAKFCGHHTDFSAPSKAGSHVTSSTLKAGIERMDFSRKKYNDACIVSKGSGCAASKYVCERVAGRASNCGLSRTPEADSVGGSYASCCARHNITSISLPPVSFLVCLEKVESSAKDAREGNMKRIPVIKLLCFMRSMTRSDITIRAPGEPSEASDFTPFATDVALHVSPTVKELEPLSSADAAQWVDLGGLLGGGGDARMNQQVTGNPCICF